MPNPRRAMGPFSFRKALVVLSCFVLCTLSLLAFCSRFGFQSGHVNLLSEAKLALSKYGGDNFRGLIGNQSNAPKVMNVRPEGHSHVHSSQEAQIGNRLKSGKLSEIRSHPEATPLAFIANSSSSLRLMQRGTETFPDVGSAATETLNIDRFAKPATLTHVPTGKSEAQLSPRFLYWGPEIDHPNAVCSGFNHQTVSLVCALNEALATGRTFLLPSHICISRRHRGLPQFEEATRVQEWGASSSAESAKMQKGKEESLGKAQGQ